MAASEHKSLWRRIQGGLRWRAQAYKSPRLWLPLAVLAVVWWQLVPRQLKLLGLGAASCYSCLEFSWYCITIDTGDGELKVAPGNKACRDGYTSPEQWYGNVLYTPCLLLLYPRLADALAAALTPLLGLAAASGAGRFLPLAVRMVAWPLNVWTLEAVMGYALMALFSHTGRGNPAWSYEGSGVALHGNVRAGHWHLWLVLGCAVEALRCTYYDGAPLVAAATGLLREARATCVLQPWVA